ncbi:MAG: DUF3592 domain-containing protein [Pseudomonadota bacterium]|nr:DUF3592 domain-containing protein [Pseudomonadota bacterium]
MPLALLTFAFGALAFWAARHIYGEVRARRDWPTVSGRILERGVGAPMKAHGRSYIPHAKYVYTVAATEYTNDQVFLVRGTGGRREWNERLVAGLPDPVPVHYDPADPARSYLLVNPLGVVWVLVGFGFFALALGLLRLLAAFGGA